MEYTRKPNNKSDILHTFVCVCVCDADDIHEDLPQKGETTTKRACYTHIIYVPFRSPAQVFCLQEKLFRCMYSIQYILSSVVGHNFDRRRQQLLCIIVKCWCSVQFALVSKTNGAVRFPDSVRNGKMGPFSDRLLIPNRSLFLFYSSHSVCNNGHNSIRQFLPSIFCTPPIIYYCLLFGVTKAKKRNLINKRALESSSIAYLNHVVTSVLLIRGDVAIIRRCIHQESHSNCNLLNLIKCCI